MEAYIKDRIKTELNATRKCLDNRHIREAFGHLRNAAEAAPDVLRQIDALEAQYFYMLRFIATDNKLDNLDDTLSGIIESMKALVQRIERAVIAETESTVYSGVLRYAMMRPEETPETLISDYLAELDRLSTDTAALTDTRRRATLERISNDIFNRLWVELPVSDDTATLITSIISDPEIPQHDRVLWIHAIGLALLKYTDRNYLDVLFALHADSDPKISTAAAVWLFFFISLKAKKDLLKRFEENHPEDYTQLIFEWCRAVGTDDSYNLLREIDPQIRRMGAEIKDKLREIDPEKMNDAEWLAANIGTDGFDSMKRFAEAQKNGDDVFMATLGKMRHFDFFNAIPNWFLPFHTTHSALAPVVDSEGAAMADSIEQMRTICDSDKYALLLSLAQTPAQMQSAAFGAMSQQIHMLMNSDEARDMIEHMAEQSRADLLNNYMKGIYRFFMLNKAGKELVNPFGKTTQLAFYTRHLEEYTEEYARIADALFRIKRYREAAALYNVVNEIDELQPARAMKHAGALELCGRKREAIAEYENILVREPDNLQARTRIAEIQLDFNNAQAAINALLPIEAAQADNLEYLRLLANAYSNAEQWTDALGVYHNIDYLLPENDNSEKGEMAWLMALSGDYAEADYYFQQAEKTPQNLRRRAVLHWLTGKRHSAIALIDEADAADGGKSLDNGVGPGFNYLAANIAESNTLGLIDEIKGYRTDSSRFGNIL